MAFCPARWVFCDPDCTHFIFYSVVRTPVAVASLAPSGNVPGIGNDYAFIDKCLDADINKITGPVKGLTGYYLIDVLSRTPFDESKYQIQRNNLRDEIYQQKKASFFNEWLANLKKDAKIVDNRYIFYGE